MMAVIDHSRTYTRRSLRNIPHRRRLRDIRRCLIANGLPARGVDKYVDFGCSTGFLTRYVHQLVAPRRTFGLDRNAASLARAREQGSGFEYHCFDLNLHGALPEGCRGAGLVTCFETLEHVGHLENAIDTIHDCLAIDGVGLLTVPIECGWRGAAKYLVKRVVFGDSLDELSSDPDTQSAYRNSVLLGRRLGHFRRKKNSWSTHFGFDYRDLEDLLLQRRIPFHAYSALTTRFIVLTG